MSLHTTEAPAPLPPSGGVGVPAPELTRQQVDQRRIRSLGTRLHPSATETCVECLYPISRHEYVRAVVVGSTVEPRLLGFVHVEACSLVLADKCDRYSEFVAVNARVVDLG